MQNTINQPVEVFVINPVHIGAGREAELVDGIDFFEDKGRVVIVDVNRIYRDLPANEKQSFTSHLASGESGAFKDYLLNKKKLKPMDYALATIHADQKISGNIHPMITTTIGTERIPYIPGSSIKGAIRSVLFDYFYQQHNGEIKNKEKQFFGSINNNLMHFLQVGDAHFKDSTVFPSKLYNLVKDEQGHWTGGWKHAGRKSDEHFTPKGFVQNYEVIDDDEKYGAKIQMRINQSRLAFIGQNDQGQLPPNSAFLTSNNPLKSLFSIINQHTRDYLNAEIAFFKEFESEAAKTSIILSDLEALLEAVPEEEDSCMLHLGFGSGFHGITGDYQYKGKHAGTPFSEDHKKRYKSRRMAFSKTNNQWDFRPLGFVQLMMVDE